MAEARFPQVYSIAAHRGFADALVAGLGPRYAEDDLGLARLTLLLPSQRAARTITEAFVRLSGSGLLLPRLVVVGDLDLDETLGPLLDPLGAGAEVPPAANVTRRWLRLAALLTDELGERAPKGAALLRQAHDIGRTLDRLQVEGIEPTDLTNERVLSVVGESAQHWQNSIRTFARVQLRWRAECDARGEVDPPARRNRLFDHAARRWKENPPANPIVAAGVTSASPALARLLRAVSELPRGAVILPDLDLSLDSEVWEALGRAGIADDRDGAPFGRGDAFTHPQYHLKLLLGRMGVARDEVQPWHRAGLAAAPPERSRAISNLFLPPKASARWVSLGAGQRRLSGVRLIESAHPGEESLAIALTIREALEEPEKRVALLTPDRELAARVIAQLERWGIEADDSAGTPLPQTAAGRLFLMLAEVAASQAAPVPLLALLGHPYAGEAFGRAEWLDHVRALDLALRGPRPAPGLAPLREIAARLDAKNKGIAAWWLQVETLFAPLLALGEEPRLGDAINALAAAAEAISGGKVWGGADGRALAGFVEDLRSAADGVGTRIDAEGLATMLRDTLDRIAVRPPWGGHPRLAIYGLIEARMSRADLVICGGMTEGTWPAAPAPEPLLAPAVLRALGVPDGDFRIGLSAHDLAAALGAPEVVLSHAKRDASGPAIPSRFVLRVRAMLGSDLLKAHRDDRPVRMAQALNDPPTVPSHPRPAPRPSTQQRDVPIAVTGLDRLRGDPYQFYASAILGLRKLDEIDAEPTAAWRGEVVHKVLENWHKNGGALLPYAQEQLARMSAHPLVRGLWWPRLERALLWIEEQVAARQSEGHIVLASEAKGEMTHAGVKITGRADRIDRNADGALAIIDYKTGKPPSKKMVADGFALQLGLIGLMARQGAFAGVAGAPERFEYWSLQKDKKSSTGFGSIAEAVVDKPSIGPSGKAKALMREDFLAETQRFLDDAITRWIKGDEPFKARLNPDFPTYDDYDQLMRLDEWLARGEEGQ
ncbi:MAG: double-strand break repair protein AddB [Novosphingobium sp.]